MSAYAIVEASGKQHRVLKGERILMDLQAEKKVGDSLVLDRVMMIGGEAGYKIGKPYLDGAEVICTVSNMGTDGTGKKGEKVRVYKKKRRKGFEKTIGHRQRYTEITINDIKG